MLPSQSSSHAPRSAPLRSLQLLCSAAHDRSCFRSPAKQRRGQKRRAESFIVACAAHAAAATTANCSCVGGGGIIYAARQASSCLLYVEEAASSTPRRLARCVRRPAAAAPSPESRRRVVRWWWWPTTPTKWNRGGLASRARSAQGGSPRDAIKQHQAFLAVTATHALSRASATHLIGRRRDRQSFSVLARQLAQLRVVAHDDRPEGGTMDLPLRPGVQDV